MIVLVGTIFGWLFPKLKPGVGFALLFAGAIAVTVLGIASVWWRGVWFNWAFIAWMEIPIAWTASTIIYVNTLERDELIPPIPPEFEIPGYDL